MDKVRVAILGATGMVGQKILSMLEDHPWFKVAALCASGRSVGRPYKEAVGNRWRCEGNIPEFAREAIVQECKPKEEVKIAFSALDAAVAGPIEQEYAKAGAFICSNSRNHRMNDDVPLVIPEINADHLEKLRDQNFNGGGIVTNPNCSAIGMTLALAPLHKAFTVKQVFATTLQAVSGAGYPGVPSISMIDNCVPHIGGEEEKLEIEPKKILGSQNEFANIAISVQCNRLAFSDGHLVSVAVGLEEKVGKDDIVKAIKSFNPLSGKNLPTAPEKPVVYLDQIDRPQPSLDRNLGNGMTVSIGKLKEDGLLDYRFIALVHNLVRGAAGAAILNAELLLSEGYLS